MAFLANRLEFYLVASMTHVTRQEHKELHGSDIRESCLSPVSPALGRATSPDSTTEYYGHLPRQD